MLGPLVITSTSSVAGFLAGGWPGAVVACLVALLFVGAVAAAAALWAERIGRLLDPEEAFRLAPRPPLLGRMCDAVYRRKLLPPRNG